MEKNHKEAFVALLIIGIAEIGLIEAAFVTDLRIPSAGQVEARVTARSGSVADIQAAVNQAISTGATDVYIPEGNWVFSADGYPSSPWPPFPTIGTNFVGINVPSTGLNILGAGINRTILDLPNAITTAKTVMFIVCGGYASGGTWHSGGKIRISGITFIGRDPNSATGDVAISLSSCKDFRVDHCSFYDMGDACIPIDDQVTQYGINGGDPARVSQGVVDHNEFYHAFKAAARNAGNGYGYGVQVVRAEAYWWIPWDDNIWDFLGKYNGNVFVEDNYFKGTRHAVASIGGGIYVFRHNIVEDQDYEEASLTGHPVRENIYGMRAFEVYDNIFRHTGSSGVRYYGPLVKGGGGLVYNNTMQDLRYAFILGNCEANNAFYPRGNVKDLYIWNNTATNCNQVFWQQSPYSSGGWTAPVAAEGTDFFSDMTGKYTTQEIQNMMTANLYTPYPYPHPLTL